MSNQGRPDVFLPSQLDQASFIPISFSVLATLRDYLEQLAKKSDELIEAKKVAVFIRGLLQLDALMVQLIAQEKKIETEDKKVERDPTYMPTSLAILTVDENGVIQKISTISSQLQAQVPFFKSCKESNSLSDCFKEELLLKCIKKVAKTGDVYQDRLLDKEGRPYEFRCWKDGERVGLWLSLDEKNDRQELGILLRDLRHDLKTYYSNILISSDLLVKREGLDLPDNKIIRSQQLRVIIRNEKAANTLLEAYTDAFFAGEAGSVEPFSKDAIEALIKTYDPSKPKVSEEDTVQEVMNVDCREFTESVLINKFHFTGVLVNLLGNAEKYRDGKDIDVKVESTAQQFTLTVTDHGKGMSQEVLSRIFRERFSTNGSTGLGLIAAQQHAKAMGGEVFCESKEGEGSTFRVVIKSARP